MKISWNWVRELVKLDGVSVHDAATRLAAAGVAVDAVTPASAGLSGAIVVEVRGKRPHPKADKLTLVDVFDGSTVTQVVCGAPNVPAPAEPGQEGRGPRVVWARPGARLPSGLELGVREVRGIPSPGMLCAEDELGLSSDHGGILILRPEDELPIGSDFAEGVGLPDYVLDLDITPNRPDLLGHVGVARELAALYAEAGARLTLPAPDLLPYLDATPITSAASVVVEDAAGCPRYLAHVATGLRVAKSPVKLRLLLSRLGSRALSNLVDATNLAMLAFGQPLHAFDLDHLRGKKIVVRRARQGETLKTLDDVVRQLHTEDVVIADAEQPIAVAGVMGGADSEVRAETTSVLLESAYFAPSSVRRTARRLKMHTEASHRFERGVDPNSLIDQAARYCLGLMLKLGSGRLLSGSIDVYPQSLRQQVIALRPARTSQILGIEVPAPLQADKLTALGLSVDARDESTLSVTVPTFRPDLLREIDLIEEIGRTIGYEAVAPRVPALRMMAPKPPSPESTRRQNAERARDLCAALGLLEVQLFSMTGPEKLARVGGAVAEKRPPLLLENPLREELSALRTQLLPGLLEALRDNWNRGQSELGLFEVGEVFLPGADPKSPLPDERTRVAGVLCGHRPHFLKPTAGDALDLFDVRGLVEELLRGLGYELVVSAEAVKDKSVLDRAVIIRAQRPDEAPWLHPGISGVISSAKTGELLGDFGEVHPTLRERLSIETRVFSFELEVPTQPRAARQYEAPSRFPAVTRDLSFFIARETPAASVCATLLSGREPLLENVAVLEDYREAGKVKEGCKGLLLGLTYRASDRTLTDEEVQKAHDRLVAHLSASLPITLR
jgi:phenylalanyl-tRNA synthetase beta chain